MRPDSLKSTMHPQGVCDARLCAATFTGPVAAGLCLQINTDKEKCFTISRDELAFVLSRRSSPVRQPSLFRWCRCRSDRLLL